MGYVFILLLIASIISIIICVYYTFRIGDVVKDINTGKLYIIFDIKTSLFDEDFYTLMSKDNSKDVIDNIYERDFRKKYRKIIEL